MEGGTPTDEKRVNDVIRSLPATHPNVTVLDLAPEDRGRPPACSSTDGIHFAGRRPVEWFAEQGRGGGDRRVCGAAAVHDASLDPAVLTVSTQLGQVDEGASTRRLRPPVTSRRGASAPASASAALRGVVARDGQRHIDARRSPTRACGPSSTPVAVERAAKEVGELAAPTRARR